MNYRKAPHICNIKCNTCAQTVGIQPHLSQGSKASVGSNATPSKLSKQAFSMALASENPVVCYGLMRSLWHQRTYGPSGAKSLTAHGRHNKHRANSVCMCFLMYCMRLAVYEHMSRHIRHLLPSNMPWQGLAQDGDRAVAACIERR